jgi:hypothetical protein
VSDSKSQDHWKALALLLDVDLPAEPEPSEQSSKEPSEEPSGEDSLESISSEADQENAEDRASGDDLSPQATGTTEAKEPPSTPKRSTGPRPRPKPATVDTSHWRGLAGELGIEVPEEEPEPDEPEPDEPEPEVEPVDDRADEDSLQSATVMPREPRVSAPEPQVEVEAADAECDDLASDDLASDDLSSDRADDPPPSRPVAAARKTPSIFEDDNFSIDTPGALDRIFEDSWAEDEPAPVPVSRSEQRDALVAFPDDEDEGEDEGEDAGEDVTDDTDVKLLDGDEDSAEIDGPAPDTAGSDEPRRRRRRRRRRKKTTGDAEVQQADETATEDSRETDQATVRGTQAVDAALDLDDDHHDDITEDDDDDLSTASVKHRKIPTWDEAVALVISNNMESRARNPGNGNRGRGRGRGRRS